MRSLLVLGSLACALVAQDPVLVPAGADAEALAAAAASVRPSARQLAWQHLGFTAFVHFGMNTFTDREWGEGNEAESLFAPTDFDADQWATTFAQAGMKGLVLTCKHHDGFCLWPSQSTQHTVAESPWREGKGNVVAEVAAACKRHGLKFGVYLSPWDRNCKAFGTPAYQEVFAQQLTELCSDYGPLFEVWFDGAHCPADDPALFDWQRFFGIVRKLQPDAVLAITGPDVRWVGNEGGRTRREEWSVLPLDTDDRGPLDSSRAAWQSLWRLRERNEAADLGSRTALAGARRLVWWPAETDVSIRPGWFYHANEDAQVKPAAKLLDLWFTAVGGNAQLLLNVPADRRGRIADADVAALRGMGAYLEATFARDLAEGAMKKRYALAGELYLPEPRTVSVIELREDVAAAGQRVEAFRIDTWNGEQWSELTTGTTIGLRRLVRIAPVETQGIRYWITQSRGTPTISTFALWRAPEATAAPTIARDPKGTVTLRGDGELHYTTDSSEPARSSPTYDKPFAMPRGGHVRAIALPKDRKRAALPAIADAWLGIATERWALLEASSEQAPGEAATKAFDGDPQTIWHTRYAPTTAQPPHALAIDLGETITVTGFVYQPRAEGDNGTIADYAFEVRGEQGPWREVARGTFAAPTNAAPAVVHLPKPAPGVRAIRLVASKEVHGRAWASCAELQVLADR